MAMTMANLAAIVMTAAVLLLLPRYLGPEVWGAYVIWLSFWGLGTQILDAGGGVVMHRALPVRFEENPGSILPFVRGLLLSKIFLFPVVWILGWLTLSGSGTSLEASAGQNLSAITLVTLSAFLFVWTSIEAGIQFSSQKVLPLGSLAALVTLFRLVAVMLFCHFLGSAGVPAALFSGTLLLWFVYQLWGMPLTRSLAKVTSREIYFPKKEYLEYGVWIAAGQFGFQAAPRLPALAGKMLGFPAESIGWMGLAIFCYMSLRQLPSAIVYSLIPHLVRLAHSEDHEEFKRHAGEAWRYTNIFLFWLILALLVLSPGWFPLLLGKKFHSDISHILWLIRWVVPALIFGTWLNFFQQLVYASRQRHRTFVVCALVVLITFPLSLWALPASLGVAQLVAALGISVGAGAVYMAFHATSFPGRLLSALFPALAFLITLLAGRWLPGGALSSLAAFLFVQSPLYFIFLVLLRHIHRQDWQRIKSALGRLWPNNKTS
jgi:O-antigen/teichoic acid export membrane protein